MLGGFGVRLGSREERGPIMEGHVEITDYFVISVNKDY